MHVVRNPHHMPHSAAHHAERANCLLLSPEHHRTPQNQASLVIIPLQFGLNPNNHPFLLGEDPFMLPPPPPSLPPGPSPATVRRQMEDLHAQAAAAAAQMMQPLGQRQRGRHVQRGDAPLPAPARPPSPDDQVPDFCLHPIHSMISCYFQVLEEAASASACTVGGQKLCRVTLCQIHSQ